MARIFQVDREAGPEGSGLLRRFHYRLRFVGGSIVGVSLFVGLSSLALFRLVALKWDRDRAVRRWLNGWSRIMCAVLGWTIDVENRERLEASRPAVLVGNHQSNLDAVIWASFYPDATVAVGKKEIRRIPIFGWLFQVTNNILIDREDPQKARASIQDAAERIRRERLNVFMAPEGHRNMGPEMLPFKKGSFHLALAAQVPIVPFVTGPIWTLLDSKRWRIRPGRIRVKVLEPISTEGLMEADVETLLLKVRTAMDAARSDLIATGGPRDW
jgi:lysophosphatidate acyltransferase